MNIKLLQNNFKFLNELITLNNGFNRTIALLFLFLCLGVNEVEGQTAQNLPYSFASGVSGLTSSNGWSQTGIGADYGDTTTPLKFDSTADVATLFIASSPSTLTYYLKGNSFSGGTFTISESANGTTFTTLRAITSLSSSNVQYTDYPLSSTRYIKWTYTNKSSGNVGLGTISITAPSGTLPPHFNLSILSNCRRGF